MEIDQIHRQRKARKVSYLLQGPLKSMLILSHGHIDFIKFSVGFA